MKNNSSISMAEYTSKFNIWDYNEHEQKMSEAAVSVLRDSFSVNLNLVSEVGQLNTGNSYSVSQLVRDSDGNISRSLKDFGRINDSAFWNTLDQVITRLSENNVYLFDLNPRNILVRQTEMGRAPVLFDFKRVGLNFYPGQPWLKVPSLARQKVWRRYERCKQEYS